MNKLNNILLEDDDPTTNFINKVLLEDMQVTEEVLLALNGRQALDVVKRQCENRDCLQLIFININMPVMNGFEFMQAYQKLTFDWKKSVVTVMLTTSLNPK